MSKFIQDLVDTLVAKYEQGPSAPASNPLDDAIRISKRDEIDLWVYESQLREDKINNAITMLIDEGYSVCK